MALDLSAVDMHHYMQCCYELAKKAPFGMARPLVGALLLSLKGEIIGEGYKKFIPGSRLVRHAERMAIEAAGEESRGSILVTTLEPCPRISRRQILSSCSELTVERGIAAVIYGLIDSSPQVTNGRGISYLRRYKVETVQCTDLSERIRKELMPNHYGLF